MCFLNWNPVSNLQAYVANYFLVFQEDHRILRLQMLWFYFIKYARTR